MKREYNALGCQEFIEGGILHLIYSLISHVFCWYVLMILFFHLCSILYACSLQASRSINLVSSFWYAVMVLFVYSISAVDIGHGFFYISITCKLQLLLVLFSHFLMFWASFGIFYRFCRVQHIDFYQMLMWIFVWGHQLFKLIIGVSAQLLEWLDLFCKFYVLLFTNFLHMF